MKVPIDCRWQPQTRRVVGVLFRKYVGRVEREWGEVRETARHVSTARALVPFAVGGRVNGVEFMTAVSLGDVELRELVVLPCW